MRYTTTRPAERLRRSVVSRYQGNPESLSPARSCGEREAAQIKIIKPARVLVASHTRCTNYKATDEA